MKIVGLSTSVKKFYKISLVLFADTLKRDTGTLFTLGE